MFDLLREQIDYLYFLKEISFLAIAVLCFLQMHRSKKDKIPWFWLGMFTSTKAFVNFLNIILISQNTNSFSLDLYSLLIYLPFIFLAEFNRVGFSLVFKRKFTVWVYLPLAVVVGLAWKFFGFDGVDLTFRYLFGFTGCLGVAFISFVSIKEAPLFARRYIVLAGYLIVFYSFLYLLSPLSTILPNGLNHLDIAVRFLGGVTAFAIFAHFMAYWYFVEFSDNISSRHIGIKHLIVSIMAFTAVLIAGFLLINRIGNQQRNISRQELLSRSMTAAAGINTASIANLKGSPADLDSPDYKRIKEQLTKTRAANKDCRYVYLLAYKNGSVRFLADSEGPSSKDYSAPGDIFNEARGELIKSFNDGRPFVEGLFPDKWEAWVSGLVPILSPKDAKVLAVLGMDIDANLWGTIIFSRRILGISIANIFCILILVFYILFLLERKDNIEVQKTFNELKTTQDQLIQSEKMAGIGQLSVVIAHELKNPLAIISMAAETILANKSNPEEKIIKYANMISAAAEKSNKIIKNLLNFSRASKFDSNPVDIHGVIDSAIELTLGFARAKNIRLLKDYCASSLIVNSDKILIEESLVNLITNSFDAIDCDGIVQLNTHRRINHTTNIDEAVIEVIDNGKGMGQDEITHIFEPFFTTKAEGRGTGLGLSTSYMIIKRYGGNIEVESKPGEGTKFIITLPVFKK